MGTSQAGVVAATGVDLHVGPRVLGAAVAIISVWMALMPFVGPLMGMPLDGAVAWQWTVDRVVLHVVPGALGALVGISMIRAAGPRRPSGEVAVPEGKAFFRLGAAAVILGAWMGAGPWLYDVFVPGAGTSGLMFLQAPGWTAMSPLHQMMLESLCHWAPGVAVGALGRRQPALQEGACRSLLVGIATAEGSPEMGGTGDIHRVGSDEDVRSRRRGTRHQRREEARAGLKRIFSPGEDDPPAERERTGADEGAGTGDTAVMAASRDTAVLEVDTIMRRSGSHEKTGPELTEAEIDAAVEVNLRTAQRSDPPFAALGRGLSNALVEMGEMVLLGGQVIKSAVVHPRGYWHEVRDDMYDALKLCWVPLVFAVMGFGFGAPGLQGGNLLYLFGVPDRLGGFFMFATIREFGPFVEAMVVAGVIGTAITADLGARRIREEIDAMEVLGVEPIRNLIVPRVISTALITMLFDMFALVLGVLSGFVAAVGFLGSTPSGYVASFFSEANIVDDWTSLAKTLLFGLVIGVVCCYKGYRAKGGPAGVGRAVNQAVVISFAMIWVIDYTFTNIMLGYSPSVQVIK